MVNPIEIFTEVHYGDVYWYLTRRINPHEAREDLLHTIWTVQSHLALGVSCRFGIDDGLGYADDAYLDEYRGHAGRLFASIARSP